MKLFKKKPDIDTTYESDMIDFNDINLDDSDVYSQTIPNTNKSISVEHNDSSDSSLLEKIRRDDNLSEQEKILEIKRLSDENQQLDEFLTEYEKDKIAKLELEEVNLDEFQEEVEPPYTKFLIMGLLFFLLLGIGLEMGLYALTAQKKVINGSEFVIKQNRKDVYDDAQSYVDINNTLNNYENEIFENLIEHNTKKLYTIYTGLDSDYIKYKEGRFDLYNKNKEESEALDKILTFKFIRNLDFLSYYLFKSKSDNFNDYRNEIFVSKQESKKAVEKYLQKHNIKYNVNDDNIVLY